jgi:hypothetical protein
VRVEIQRPVEVDCAQGQSITAALERLRAHRREPLTPQVIRVSGTCNESVVVEGFDQLTIQGMPGATLTATATGDDSAAIRVVGSRNVEIEDLAVDGAAASAALRIDRCLDCAVRRTSILGGGWGIVVIQPGHTSISEIAISGVTMSGVLVTENASARMWDAVIVGTGWFGVWAATNGTITLVGTTVRGFHFGLGATGGLLQSYPLADFTGDRTIRVEDNTDAGIWAADRGHLQLGGSDTPIVISNNGERGVFADDSRVALLGGVEITGHTFSGVEATRNGTVVIKDATIDGNRFGILADRKGLVGVQGLTTISTSSEDAILALHSSQVSIDDTTMLRYNAHNVTCDVLSEIVDFTNLDTGGGPLLADCPNLH